MITSYFNYEPRFNGVFSRKNLPSIKDGVYWINLDDRNSEGTHWVSFFIDVSAAAYFDSFGIEYIPLKVLNKIRYKSMTLDIFRVQDHESINCGASRKNVVRLYLFIFSKWL